ncbi:PREDICTED: protein ELF4-LIKE 3-like isoform X2 [Ipomoea nil]|uniref:protein ELF4-LIKE 3-like isoform X2 n=1 Tax=Ipomoea nil TaxID=35883 RepID=UPI00090121B5|nr:PREDICTED: protein ELF4-LIKE 3-like isoform X2 [Ipomoea nil]
MLPDFQGVVLSGQEMDGDTFSGAQMIDGKVLQTFQKSFVQVQTILDHNRLLISEINQNHESKSPDNLNRNVGLIKELNNNIRKVVDLYAGLSTSFSKTMDASSEGDSSGGPQEEQARLDRLPWARVRLILFFFFFVRAGKPEKVLHNCL